MFKKAKLVKYLYNQTVIQKGDKLDYVYIIIDGDFQLCVKYFDKKPHPLY